jgi:hypothetical protein
MAQSASLWAFARAFRKHLFAAMSGGFSVPFTALAVFADNKYAQGIFGCLAFSAAWFAAYRIWKSEREKVVELENKLAGKATLRSSLSLLADNLQSAREMVNRKVENEDQLKQLGKDYNVWIRKVVEEIANSISIAAAKAYSSAPAPMAAHFPGSLNNSHNDLRSHIDSCLKRLGDLISQYDKNSQ